MHNFADIAPHMTPAETALLTSHIPVGGRVLEFGCGGSTPYFLSHEVLTLTSVDSDKEWLKGLMDQNPIARHFLLKKRWFPIHADIGPTGAWGTTQAKSPEIHWLRYHQESWDYMRESSYELVLIDGRFRVACFCQTLLRCPLDTLTIVVHDFWDRPEYHVMLEFAEVLDRADMLVVLRPHPAPDWKKLALTLQAHLFDQD